MSLPINVVIDGVDYAPLISFSENISDNKIVKGFLFELFYIFYFDHWHRKNGPISSCIEMISPEFMSIIETEDLELIKKSVGMIDCSMFVVKGGGSMGLSCGIGADVDNDNDYYRVMISGVKYVPVISFSKNLDDNDVRRGMVALAEAYLYQDNNYNSLKSYVKSRLLEFINIFSPKIGKLIELNKLSVVYKFLSNNEDLV